MKKGGSRANSFGSPFLLFSFLVLYLWFPAPIALGEPEVYGGDEYESLDRPKSNRENDYELHRRLRRQQREKVRNYRRRRQQGPAREGFGKAGCGLGANIFGSRPGGVQILAATSNASTFNQTFAISSGTSKCTGKKKERWLGAFLRVNAIPLQTQAARGSGEAWQTLPSLTGCSPPQKVLSLVQEHWDPIGEPDPEAQATHLLETLRNSGEVNCAS